MAVNPCWPTINGTFGAATDCTTRSSSSSGNRDSATRDSRLPSSRTRANARTSSASSSLARAPLRRTPSCTARAAARIRSGANCRRPPSGSSSRSARSQTSSSCPLSRHNRSAGTNPLALARSHSRRIHASQVRMSGLGQTDLPPAICARAQARPRATARCGLGTMTLRPAARAAATDACIWRSLTALGKLCTGYVERVMNRKTGCKARAAAHTGCMGKVSNAAVGLPVHNPSGPGAFFLWRCRSSLRYSRYLRSSLLATEKMRHGRAHATCAEFPLP
jgi:hypothetical protein